MTSHKKEMEANPIENQSSQVSSGRETSSSSPPLETWVVRAGDVERHYRKVDNLLALAREGRLKPEYYVYHPLLKKWLYAKDVQELVPAFKRESAGQLNKLSWGLFLVALLTGFAGLWLVAAILFIAAMVLSILYHVKR